jgi:hypothetical protein
MLPDLNMTGTDYNVALAIFFVPYVLCGNTILIPVCTSFADLEMSITEVPSNILLAKFRRPSVYLAILTVLWGIIVTLTGVVQSFGALCAVRVLLGIFE